MLNEVIGKQSGSLQELNVCGNYFSIDKTEKLFTSILESGVLSTLKELSLFAGANNFETDVVVEKFADILATAPVLKKVDITNQITID